LVALHHGAPPARLLLLHDALRAFGGALCEAGGAPLGPVGAQQARWVAAAVRSLLPLTRSELRVSEASALSAYLAAVTAAPAPAGAGQATGGPAGQPRRLACLLGWRGSEAGGGGAGGSERVAPLLQAALCSLKDEERRTLDWHLCSHSSHGRGASGAPGAMAGAAVQPSAAVAQGAVAQGGVGQGGVGQLALCGASALLRGCLDGARPAGLPAHVAVAAGLAALCDILRKARAALDSAGEQRDEAGGGGGAGGGAGGAGGAGDVATPVVNLSGVARVAAVACLRSAAARESVGFGVLRCGGHGAYIGVETGAAAASGAAQRLLLSEPRQERGLRTRLQHAVLPTAADTTAASAAASESAAGERKGSPPAVPLVIMTDPGKDQDDELALILCRTMCDPPAISLRSACDLPAISLRSPASSSSPTCSAYLRRHCTPSLHSSSYYYAPAPTRCDLGLFELRGVVANLCPAAARAKLARGTLDALALEAVPVAVGSDANRSGIEDNFTASARATGFDYLVREAEEAEEAGEAGEAEEAGQAGEAGEAESCFEHCEGKGGLRLLLRTYLAAEEHSLTLLIIAAMTDAAAFIEAQPSLFASRTRAVAIIGRTLTP